MKFEKEWFESDDSFLAISSTGIYLWVVTPDLDYNETLFTAGVDKQNIGEFSSLEEAKQVAENYYERNC